MAKAIAARFLAVLGPLYALSTVLNQTNSGFGVFQKAVNVLGATLAPILLPVFAVLAASILSVSDILWSKLLPALGGFYDWIMKVMIPFAEKKLGQGNDLLDTGIAGKNLLTKGELPKAADIPRMGDSILRNIVPGAGAYQDKFGGLKDMTNWAGRQLGYKDFNQLAVAGGSQSSAAADTTKPKGTDRDMPNFGRMFSQNMSDVIQSLRMSMSPKGSYSSLGDVGKQAQLAAINADPIEMKAAERIIKSIEEFQKAFDRYQSSHEPKEQINRRYSDGSGIGPTGNRVR